MSVKDYPSIDYVRQALEYRDGKLYWRERPREHFETERAWKNCNTRFTGIEAGNPSVDPRARDRSTWRVSVAGKKILRHVIIWAMHHGEWRLGLDHEDRNSLNDRVENLRPCTQSQNRANSRHMIVTRSGCKGVTWAIRNKKWRSRIMVDGRRFDLGLFDDPEEARAAYVAAAKKYFGDFYCAG